MKEAPWSNGSAREAGGDGDWARKEEAAVDGWVVAAGQELESLHWLCLGQRYGALLLALLLDRKSVV